MAAGVVVQEVPSYSPEFENGTTNAVEYQTTATFGSPATFNFDQLVYLDTLLDSRWRTGDLKMVDCLSTYIAANFDSSGLGLSSGDRAGWAICNGNNGTLDRRGRFPIAYDDRATDPENGWWDALYNTIGATGGEKLHTLNVEEMPSHTHVEQVYQAVNNGGDHPVGYSGVTGGLVSDGTNTEATGGGEPHNNIPPFIVTLFIQKL